MHDVWMAVALTVLEFGRLGASSRATNGLGELCTIPARSMRVLDFSYDLQAPQIEAWMVAMSGELHPNGAHGRSPPVQTLLTSHTFIPERGTPLQRAFRRRAAPAHVSHSTAAPSTARSLRRPRARSRGREGCLLAWPHRHRRAAPPQSRAVQLAASARHPHSGFPRRRGGGAQRPEDTRCPIASA